MDVPVPLDLTGVEFWRDRCSYECVRECLRQFSPAGEFDPSVL